MKHFLIVVDMQKDFVDGALGTPEAQSIVGKVMDKILGFDGQIFATLDTHRENYLDTAEGKKLPVPHCIKGTPGWMLDSGVAAALEQKGYTPVEKLTFGSVLLPRLLYQAAAGETFTMELVGLCTDICVVSNALRLNLFKLRDPKHDHKHRKKPASANTAPAEEKTTTKKEKETMKKTMKIEGMMCTHCEAAVKKALEAIPEVVDAEVSHTAGTAVVTLQSPVDDAALKKAVEDKDYKVLGIE